MRFLQQRRVVRNLRVAQELETILAFIGFFERDLELRLEFGA